MVLQVLLLMVHLVIVHVIEYEGTDANQPLRTIMNYQYRFGTSFTTATRTLYHAGGLGRYYQGLTAALVQGM